MRRALYMSETREIVVVSSHNVGAANTMRFVERKNDLRKVYLCVYTSIVDGIKISWYNENGLL